jgi:hypothetical protein
MDWRGCISGADARAVRLHQHRNYRVGRFGLKWLFDDQKRERGWVTEGVSSTPKNSEKSSSLIVMSQTARQLGEQSTEGPVLKVVNESPDGNSATSLELPHFQKFDLERWTKEVKWRAVRALEVKKVISFALGPDGTNIAQAARQWSEKLGITQKTEIVLCDLPETAVQKALAIQEEGVLGVFWTCAVFKRLHEIFFRNAKTFPFFFKHTMLLDDMQLAGLSREASKLDEPASMVIATHVSPAPLVACLVDVGARLVDAKSNAEAAQMCEEGKVTACITTGSAQVLYGLATLHEFGSPPMIFFGGITEQGFRLLEKAAGYSDVTLPLNS